MSISICDPFARFFFSPPNISKSLELIGRTCYDSQSKICDGSDEGFLENIMNRGHESVIEHVHVTVHIVCDRGISHEIVRHRLANYTQKSTRYVNSSKKGFVYIPPFLEKNELRTWFYAMQDASKAYENFNLTPQISRSVLPNSLQTELFMTANLREWRHVFKMRCAHDAHPQMREIMIPLLRDMYCICPVIFDDMMGLYNPHIVEENQKKRINMKNWFKELLNEKEGI